MLIERPFYSIRKLFPNAVWKKPGKQKVVYLTFDDGPVPEVTPDVLALLKKYEVKATFFCVGENVCKYPEVYDLIIQQGHTTGNHTYNHLRGFNTSLGEYTANVKKASGFIKSNLFRPPYGRITRKQLDALNKDYTVIMWDLITRDYNPRVTPQQIMGYIKKLTRNGSIIVFHDSVKAKKNVLGALAPTIEYLQKEGYRFETL
jgi:peptidoglycan-N-acetylglucosamine deacetylase